MTTTADRVSPPEDQDPKSVPPIRASEGNGTEWLDPSRFASSEQLLSGPNQGPTWPVRFGRYLLEGEVARGGMGVILRARDTLLGRVVVFKVLLPEHRGNPELVRRFRFEARIASLLQHPGTTPVYDFGSLPDGCPYFTMRLIGGDTLAQVLANGRTVQLSRPHLLKIFEAVCQAIAYAHAQGVVHRDLKPANVMVDAFGVVKVMDWGIAKVLPNRPAAEILALYGGAAPMAERGGDHGKCEDGEPRTAVGSIFGTLEYMSPEQARGDCEQTDERSDVFGLGAILCEILTGEPPYPRRGQSARKVRRRASQADLADAFERLRACRSEPELVELATHCLAADPNDRPRDASQVAAAVTGYMASDLRRAEWDLVRFFELSLDMFCLAGTNGYFRRVNANFTRVLGYSADELVSQPFIDLVHPDDRFSTQEAVAQLSRGEPIVRFRNRYRSAKGGFLWIEWTAKSIPDEQIIYAVARDVTYQVENS